MTSTDDTGQHRAPDQGLWSRLNLSEPVRLRLYGIAVPAAALLAGYGLLGPDEAARWLALAAAVLCGGSGAAELVREAVVSPVTAKRAAVDAVELAAAKPMHPFTAAGLALEHNSIPQP